MSFRIIRANCPIDNKLLLFQFSATESDGPMNSGRSASAVAYGATTEASCFARPQATSPEVKA